MEIISSLLKHPVLKHKEIAEHLPIASSTISYHLSILVDNGVLDVRSRGKEKGYFLKDRDEIIRILKKYELHIELHLAVEGFKDAWKDLNY